MLEIKNLKKNYGKTEALKILIIHLKTVYMDCLGLTEQERVRL